MRYSVPSWWCQEFLYEGCSLVEPHLGCKRWVPSVIGNQNLNHNSTESFPSLRCGEWKGESASGHKGRQKSIGAWFSSRFAPFPAQLIWFCGQGAVTEVWIHFTILGFLSNLFETLHCTCIEAFEFRSHNFGIFALQPRRRAGAGWMTAHVSSSSLEWAREER